MDRKRIFYGVSGEGLGHCSRALTLIQSMPEYEFHIFTWGDAYEYLNQISYPFHLHKIPGLKFGRVKGKINTWLTIINFLWFYFFSIGKAIKEIRQLAKTKPPELVISDFEPILARAAKPLKTRLVSIDTQHKFGFCSWIGLPWELKLYSLAASLFIWFYIPNPHKILVSTFYYNLVKPITDRVNITNIFVRNELKDRSDLADHGFILMYYKQSVGLEMMKCLKGLDIPVVAYGVPKEHQTIPEFTYKDVSQGFQEDLKKCRYVFCAAGNQLLGEAITLGKPVFTVPEPNQHEQTINGWYVEKGGNGVCCPVKKLTPERVKSFLDEFRPIHCFMHNGIIEATQIIKDELE